MSTRYQIETLVRPLVEVPAGLVSMACALAIGLLPQIFWVPTSGLAPDVASSWRVLAVGHVIIVMALVANAIKRFVQAYRIARYQSHLRRLPKYEMVGDDIPSRPNGLFLGRGFTWDERHTRRVAEASRDAAKPFLSGSWLDRWFSRGTVNSNGDEGGRSYLHGVGLWETKAEQELWLSDMDRMGQILALGSNGVGKSRLLEVVVAQDIRGGGPVLIIDPKGDVELLMQAYAAARDSGREADFICFHLAFPELSARYNMFGSFARVTEIASRIRDALPDSGNSAAFAEFAWSYVNTIAVGMHALGRRTTIKSLLENAKNMEGLISDYAEHRLANVPDWKSGFDALCDDIAAAKQKGKLARNEMDKDPRALALVRLMHKYQQTDAVFDSLVKTFSYEKAYQDKLVASLFPLLQKMSTGSAADILSPNYDDINDKRPILEFEAAFRANKVIYVGLDSLTDGTVADAVGGSMVSDLASLAGRIYNYTRGQGLSDGIARNHKRIRINIDEWNAVGRSDPAIALLNKSRGAGMDIFALSQSAADQVVGFGDVHKANQAIDNFNTVIMMRVKSEASAEILTNGLSEVIVPSITWGSGSTDSGSGGLDFSSNQTQKITEARVPLVSSAHIVTLPRGQAFVSAKGGQLFKVRFPMPLPSRRTDLPRTVPELAKALLNRHAKPTAPWEAEQAPWHDRLPVAQVPGHGEAS